MAGVKTIAVMTAAAALFAAIAAGAGANRSRAQACAEGLDVTHSGPTVSVFCGPATATMKYGGHSYPFTKGTCRYESELQGGQPFRLELGILFRLFKQVWADSLLENHLFAAWGTRSWAADGVNSVQNLTLNVTSDGGTFKTTSALLKVAGRAVASKATVTGSFKCH
jgi:hypothetical protein